jgi:preprotein translocase subunit YajC
VRADPAANAGRPDAIRPAGEASHSPEDHGMLLISDAFAQGLFGRGAGASGSPNSNLSMMLYILQFLPIILIFYLLLIRPQQVQQKKLKHMLSALKKGDKVVTSGGIIGTIVGIDEQKAVLRISEDVKVEFLKSAIVSVVTEGSAK